MKFYNALSDFLYDKKYFITLFENKIHVFRYRELIKLSSELIALQIESFKLIINGRNLIVSQKRIMKK